jgi:L-rhamnose isomerase
MKGFYQVTDKLKTLLNAEPFVNTVTYGSIDDVDLDKQSIFPLSHIIVNNAVVGTKTTTFSISVLAMDIVDISNDKVTDTFVGNDNEQDVLNTQLALLTRVINELQRGDSYTDKYQVQEDVTCEPFVDRFENKLAGWTATFSVMAVNDMTVC